MTIRNWTTLDVAHLTALADKANTARDARALLRNLDSFGESLYEGSPTGTTRSAKLTEAVGHLPSGPWRGPTVANLVVDPNNTGETAAQRAFFLHGEIVVRGKHIELLDLEFPTRPDQYRIDLLGRPADSPLQRTIVEIKYEKPNSNSNSKADSPVKALLQALAYAVDASVHQADLALQSRHAVSRRDVERFPDGWMPTLLIAGNQIYWQNWKRRLDVEFEALQRLEELVVLVLGDKSWILFAEFPDLPIVPDDGRPYLPRVPCSSCVWTCPW